MNEDTLRREISLDNYENTRYMWFEITIYPLYIDKGSMLYKCVEKLYQMKNVSDYQVKM